MAKVEAVEIRPGQLLEWDKRVWRVLKSYHVHVGAIGVELPPSVVLTVVDTEPGIKHSTATTSFKPARLETGITVQVPPFVTTGEKIKVDTAEGTYMERA